MLARPTTTSPKAPVYLVDASIYIFRAWYSMPEDFADRSGRPTNAVYGFARFLCELIEQTRGRYIGVAFDESLSSSFRNEIDADYKANRSPAPPDLERQFGWCRDLVGCLGLPQFRHSRFEADDLIATLVGCCRGRGQPVAVITGDKDLAQLIGPGDTWWDFARNTRLDAAAIQDRFGVRPDQIADLLALTGDKVDNIPGVPGIGPKTAAALLRHFDSIDRLFERLDEIAFLKLRGAAALAPRLRIHEQRVRISRRLTGLDTEISAILNDSNVERGPVNADGLDALLDALGFGPTLRQRLHNLKSV
ncbi:MAG: exodeoxyribonuclease IX [Xanthomonadaceae bacterium]|nr:exodeoxyribonuclease IX [Xanthomonadaceae bacterium]